MGSRFWVGPETEWALSSYLLPQSHTAKDTLDEKGSISRFRPSSTLRNKNKNHPGVPLLPSHPAIPPAA